MIFGCLIQIIGLGVNYKYNQCALLVYFFFFLNLNKARSGHSAITINSHNNKGILIFGGIEELLHELNDL